MDQPELTRCSKFLSFVLRHKPDAIGLDLDEYGWASVDELIDKAKPQIALTYDLIVKTVHTNDKQRFVLSKDGQRIRATQGHSIKVDIGLEPKVPPDVLFHGTATRFLSSIKKQGLKPGQRQHVHLSTDRDSAISVGNRYGKPVILEINARAMNDKGIPFFQSENGVWLVEHVPIGYIGNLTEVE